MSDVVYEQAHRFVLMNHPTMEAWMDQYIAATEGTSTMPHFQHWVREAVLQVVSRGNHVPQEALDIRAGPNKKTSDVWSL
jgi:hypothetical protein